MKWRVLLLLLCGMLVQACRLSLTQVQNPVSGENQETATAPAAAPELPGEQNTSEALKALLLTPEDLPVEARYYLPDPGSSSPFHNTEVVAAWGGLPGWDYLQATGRVDGYYADYLRGSETASAPEELFCNIVEFETPEGARLSLTDYNLVAMDEPGGTQWSYVERPGMDLGDIYLILSTREPQPGGVDRLWYRIEFSHQNYVGVVAGFGWENQVTHEFMENAARALLGKIEAAPLVQP